MKDITQDPNSAPPVPDDKKTDPTPAPSAQDDKKTEPNPAPPAKSYSQDDIDAAVAKAVASAKADWDKQAKLAKLPEDEAAKEKLRQDREQFDRDRAELDRRILEADAKDMLAAEGIPAAFAKNVLGADAKETKSNVEAFAKEWKAQMSAQVDEKLKGRNPKDGKSKEPDDPFLSGFLG